MTNCKIENVKLSKKVKFLNNLLMRRWQATRKEKKNEDSNKETRAEFNRIDREITQFHSNKNFKTNEII